ncbi:glycosyltransferase [Patescibacteria group bacterium]|nr:glycosyltransferase [Patescibacteria group bacterium]MDE1946801.1 glycosyltransferase family 4 protein [Patescibacteria group bacterium]MDE2011139.1 glycosyltransferase family 4 protein [Patescibacteria group bacterium]MDE2233048.1 glycosyltransferase family 4 protein [Patescibacteria group bacterium]
MKLLIITQKVDKDDPILGFFHRWIEEFAKRFEKVTVVCLEKGRNELPAEVKVLSLGKENGRSRMKYLAWFYRYIWQERKNYDAVFVHMNQEYVILGGLVWKLFGKKVALWRNHRKGNWLTRLAVSLADIVFYTSPQSFTAGFKKAMMMPVGVDTDLFRPHPEIERNPNSILFLGRISPVKRVDVFVERLKEMRRAGKPFTATIVGSPTDRDGAYHEKIKKMISDYSLGDLVIMKPAVKHEDTVGYYCSHEIYANFTEIGSMDKTIFEAAACGAKVETENGIIWKDVDLKGQGLERLADKITHEISA